MIQIIIANSSDTPIYQQLFDQISAQIIKGDLIGDHGLPPIRTVAKELRVSIITVKKAWEELEREGLIYTVVGRGCFIVPLSEEELLAKKRRLASAKIEKDISYYKNMGLTFQEFITLSKELYGSDDA